MAYKRLTKRNGIEIEVESIQKSISRLADLEDMIESGLLFKLPCKEGDPVYKVYRSCDANAMDCPYYGGYGHWRCHYKDKCRCKPFVDEIQFNITLLDEVGKTIFTTKAEAEAKLEELRGKV